MKNIKFLFLTGLTAITLSYASPAQAGGFKLVKQDHIISLYERWVSGSNGEKVRELKAVFKVRADLTAIKSLLTDQQKGPAWNSNTTAYDILRSENKNSWITYIKYDIPWPFDDQDCCLQYHLREDTGDGNTSEITFQSVANSRFPESGQADRIKGIRGKWLINDLGNGTLKITYLITTNRSKNIPRWISDPIIHRNLFNTMTAFKNMLEHAQG